MLQFVEITVDNFGPYKGKNTIPLPDEEGVSIIWGDNGRGKTTLLNAFRYGLFGRVQRRRGTLVTLREMENYESRAEGRYGFSVSIKMQNEEDIYLLTRSFTPREGVMIPQSDADYEKKTFLKKNGSLLSPEQRDHVLNTLMPEQVSRFFLFDGELLQEYEELVINEATSGEHIKKSIEKILGVPVLQNGAIDLEDISYEYERSTTRLAQKNDQTKRVACHVTAMEQEVAEHVAEIERLRGERELLVADKRKAQEDVEATEQIRAWLSERDAKQQELERLKQRKEEILGQITIITNDCWRGMLSARLAEAIQELNLLIQGLEKKKQASHVAEKFLEEMKSACADKRCPVCTQEVAGDILSLLLKKISTSESMYSGLSEEEADELMSLQSQMAVLKKLTVTDRREALALCEAQLSSLTITQGELQQAIAELNKNIREYENENGASAESKECVQRLVRIETKISNIDTAIALEISKRDEAIQKKDKYLDQLKRLASANGEMSAASRRQELCHAIYAIFNEGVDTYSRRLKENVERDATALFTQIANDKAYVALRINDNYGLNIVLADGTIVPGRSAGYEHVVALSLIGALHKNAPLQGPIIMDTPFGRLDPTHKSNIIKVLPSMANQVMLLVYTGEIDEQMAREKLGHMLRSEKRLTRVSSMHTRIE